MSSIGGLLGLGGGASGSGFSAPTGTNPQQINNAYGQTQSGIAQQQGFVNALGAQNGLGNQASVFNQLQGVANGTGPNPAKAQLAQATGQNVANQAALMAGQRGSAANAGLIARQAAQQGAQTQQQAAGQAATLQAQQSLGAMNSLGNIANTQVGQQQAGLSALNQNSLQQQSNLLGIQGNMNTNNAGLAGASQTAQSGLLGGIGGGIAGAAGSMLGGGGGAASDIGGSEGDLIDTIDLGAQGGEVGHMADGGDPNAINGGLGASGLASGSVAQQTPSAPQQTAITQLPQDGPKSGLGQQLKSGGSGGGLGAIAGLAGKAGMGFLEHEALPAIGNALGDIWGGISGLGSAIGSGATAVAGGVGDAVGAVGAGAADAAPLALAAAEGGRVPALVSPGEQYLPPKDVKQVLKTGKSPLATGERIKGKPKYPGNDYRNDTVPKTLEAGGVVIPNKIMQGPNPHWEAMKFVHQTMAKKGKLPGKK